MKRLLLPLAGVAVGLHAAPYALTLAAYDWRFQSVYKYMPDLYGLSDSNHVALTFDDGPHPQGTPEILDLLDEYDWKATFFMLGRNVEQFGDVANEVVSRGHEIASHGYSHRSFMKMPLPTALDELKRTAQVIGETTGVDVELFRPPYGTLSASAVAGAHIEGLDIKLWTAWGRDWEENTSPVQVAGNVNKGLLPGGTVLLHDSDCTSAPNSWHNTVKALPLLAELFAHDGLRVGPLREH